MGYGLWVMGYGLWVMGYGLWVIGYGLWVMCDAVDHPVHLGVQGIGFRASVVKVWGIESRVWGLGFRVWVLWCRLLGFGVLSLPYMVYSSWFVVWVWV